MQRGAGDCPAARCQSTMTRQTSPAALPWLDRLALGGEMVRLAQHRLRRHWRRYLGPFSAVLLGCAGVIVVLTTSDEFKLFFAANLEMHGGSTVFDLHFQKLPGHLPWGGRDEFFQPRMAQAVLDMTDVEQVSLVGAMARPARLVYRDRTFAAPLLAVDRYFGQLQQFVHVEGEFFSLHDVDHLERVCVIGSEVARGLFGREEVAGEDVLIEGESYRITGVLRGLRIGAGSGLVFVPMSTALHRLPEVSLPLHLLVRVPTWEHVQPVADRIPEVLAQYVPVDRLVVDVDRRQLALVLRVARSLEIFANVCVLVTLALGGIGIWNVTLASVRARTEEIALKKAVGAEDGAVLVQFLAESVLLCAAAAAGGLLLGWLTVQGIALLLHSPMRYDLFWASSLRAGCYAVVLGVAAGLYPARLASRMEVAVALRNE